MAYLMRVLMKIFVQCHQILVLMISLIVGLTSMNKANVIAICFAVGYLSMCLFIWSLHFEGSWGGMIMFLLALPFSVLSIVISNSIGGAPAFLIMNAIWWYFLIRLIFYIKHRKPSNPLVRQSDESQTR